jgi:heat shock protein HslJ
MRGFGGCNTYSATAYPMARQGFAVGPVAVTRKACDKVLMEREKNFLLGIRTSAQWEEKDGFLILRGQMGEIKFQRAL